MNRYEILDIIYGAIAEVSPAAAESLSRKNDPQADCFFVDLGINSIDYAEIAHIVMNKLNIIQPIDIFTCTNRISDVANILYKLTAKEKGDKGSMDMEFYKNSHQWTDAVLS